MGPKPVPLLASELETRENHDDTSVTMRTKRQCSGPVFWSSVVVQCSGPVFHGIHTVPPELRFDCRPNSPLRHPGMVSPREAEECDPLDCEYKFAFVGSVMT